MRRCPLCNQTYNDRTLKFCRVDGEPLSADISEPPDTDPTVDLSIYSDSYETTRWQSVNLPSISNAPSIAVLPFVNMSADQDNDYFCDGLAEEILNALAHVDGLKVAARTSAFFFKGKDVKIGDVGASLKVSTVLEGSVRKHGNRLRVTAQLINVADGYHLWSERYDREMEDVFEIQDQITVTIVEALKPKLLGVRVTTPLRRPPSSTDAYVAYLKGRYQLSKFSVDGFTKAIECFDEATARDENYAPAYAGMAHARSALWYYGVLSPEEIIPKWKAAAERALEIDPNLVEAHASLGNIQFYHDWDFKAAEKSFLRALELNPNNADAHWFYGLFLASRGEFDEAVCRGKRAVELDPLSIMTNIQVGWICWLSNRMDEAVSYGQRVVEINPSAFGAYWLLASSYLCKAMTSESFEAHQKSLSLGGGSIVLSSLGRSYGVCGKREEALKIVARLVELKKQRYVPSLDIARVYLGLNDNDRAFEWLERAFEERNGELVFLKLIATIDALPSEHDVRKDPRYGALIKRIGIA
jgi:adenylate cyclase